MKIPMDEIQQVNERLEEGYKILHTWEDSGAYFLTVKSVDKDIYFLRVFECGNSYHLSEDGFIDKGDL